MTQRVHARPHDFPLDGRLEAAALLVIDMQADFCGEGGYMHRRGFDLAGLRSPVEPIRSLLAAWRRRALPVAYTREAFSPDLSDLQPHRRHGGAGLARVGDAGATGRCLVRGEPGWEIIPELAPAPADLVWDKPGYGLFAFTDAERELRARGVSSLVLTGVTTDCCVHTILREALDRGFDCLVLADCCAASTREMHDHAIALIDRPGATFGALSDSVSMVRALDEHGR